MLFSVQSTNITGGKLVVFTVLPSNATLPVTVCTENSLPKKQVKMFFCGKHLHLFHSLKYTSALTEIIGWGPVKEETERKMERWILSVLQQYCWISNLYLFHVSGSNHRGWAAGVPTAWKCDIYHIQCKTTTENQFLITWLESEASLSRTTSKYNFNKCMTYMLSNLIALMKKNTSVIQPTTSTFSAHCIFVNSFD